MTTVENRPASSPALESAVYEPQHDSYLLVHAMTRHAPPRGLAVADLCTGSGVVAMAAAEAGAATVHAYDVSAAASACATARAAARNLPVTVHHAPWTAAASSSPFDLITCNPPYVPETPCSRDSLVVMPNSPALAVNGGLDGRLILDPLCAAAPDLLRRHGTLLVVQSEFADIGQTVKTLRHNGLRTAVVARKSVPFGPVLARRALWFEQVGLLEPGRRSEMLTVIAAVKP